MIDGGHDKAGIRKCLGDIVMAEKGTAPAVGDDDKRKPVTSDRTIFDPLQGDVAEVDLARRCGAG